MSAQPPPTPAAGEAAYRDALLTTGASATPGRSGDAVVALSFSAATTSPRRVSRRGRREAGTADDPPSKKQDVSATPPRPLRSTRVEVVPAASPRAASPLAPPPSTTASSAPPSLASSSTAPSRGAPLPLTPPAIAAAPVTPDADAAGVAGNVADAWPDDHIKTVAAGTAASGRTKQERPWQGAGSPGRLWKDGRRRTTVDGTAAAGLPRMGRPRT